MAASGACTSAVMPLRAVGEWLITPARSGPRLRHRRAGYAVAALLAPVLAVVPAVLRGELNPTTGVLAGLVAVLAVMVGLLADNAARCAGQAAAADESLGQLSHLLARLLDVSRLQVGVQPVFPRPADLDEIIADALAGIGPQALAVTVRIPLGLPRIMVDPSLMERVIANVTANALRYSPNGSPPLLTASAGGGKVILRVVDYGPGVPKADHNRIFAAFQRLGDNDGAIGVGLGLTVSRCLAEAMHGTLKPEETPGGGLTMAIAVPSHPLNQEIRRRP